MQCFATGVSLQPQCACQERLCYCKSSGQCSRGKDQRMPLEAVSRLHSETARNSILHFGSYLMQIYRPLKTRISTSFIRCSPEFFPDHSCVSELLHQQKLSFWKSSCHCRGLQAVGCWRFIQSCSNCYARLCRPFLNVGKGCVSESKAASVERTEASTVYWASIESCM